MGIGVASYRGYELRSSRGNARQRDTSTYASLSGRVFGKQEVNSVTSGLPVIRPELGRTIPSRIKSNFPQRDFWLLFTGFTSTCALLYGRVNLVRMTISSAVSQSFPSNRKRSFLISPTAASISSVFTPAAILSAQWIWRWFNIFITRRLFFVRRTSLALL